MVENTFEKCAKAPVLEALTAERRHKEKYTVQFSGLSGNDRLMAQQIRKQTVG